MKNKTMKSKNKPTKFYTVGVLEYPNNKFKLVESYEVNPVTEDYVKVNSRNLARKVSRGSLVTK